MSNDLANDDGGTTPEELEAEPRLDGWSFVIEGRTIFLLGQVTGHPTLPDGKLIKTSAVEWFSTDYSLACTGSRRYRLGKREV